MPITAGKQPRVAQRCDILTAAANPGLKPVVAKPAGYAFRRWSLAVAAGNGSFRPISVRAEAPRPSDQS